MNISINNKIRFSSDFLKLLAIIMMAIDHAGYGLLYLYLTTTGLSLSPDEFNRLDSLYDVMNGVGRLAFPIFMFFIVEGFFHTGSRLKYALRLFLFGLLSEIPFNLALYQKVLAPEHQNVMFSLCLSLLTIWAIDYIRKVPGLSDILTLILICCLTCASMQLSQILLLDYKWHAILLVVVLYLLHDFAPVNLLAGGAVMSFEKYAPVSFLLLYLYDETIKPNKKLKYFFYIFYPAHLLLIYLIGCLLGLGL